MIKHKRVSKSGFISQQAKLCSQHSWGAAFTSHFCAQPSCKVGNSSTCEHRVCLRGNESISECARTKNRSALPVIRRGLKVGRHRSRVGFPRVALSALAQTTDAFRPKKLQILSLVCGFKHPFGNPLIECRVILTADLSNLRPKLQVFSVGLGRGKPPVQSAGMSTQWTLCNGQDLMGWDANEVGPWANVVHNSLYRCNHAALGSEGTPDTFEHWRVKGNVPGCVCNCAVDERNVWSVGLQHPDCSKWCVHSRIALICLH
ncbi:unannotated protein [freshwater metagenome]|uniref:Unannotated protein n=1 Tax=freshwater metagenome TaxID=449393 RepID=A0A6J7RZE9_9ZZZZ